MVILDAVPLKSGLSITRNRITPQSILVNVMCQFVKFTDFQNGSITFVTVSMNASVDEMTI